MSDWTVEKLLQPIAGDNPYGFDVGGTDGLAKPSFQGIPATDAERETRRRELELFERRVAAQNFFLNANRELIEPACRRDAPRGARRMSWETIRGLVVGHLEVSRHLLFAVWLTMAETELHGIAGLQRGLVLLEGMLNSPASWDQVHPRPSQKDLGVVARRRGYLERLAIRLGNPDDSVRFFEFLAYSELATLPDKRSWTERGRVLTVGDILAVEPRCRYSVPSADAAKLLGRQELVEAARRAIGDDSARDAYRKAASASLNSLESIQRAFTSRTFHAPDFGLLAVWLSAVEEFWKQVSYVTSPTPAPGSGPRPAETSTAPSPIPAAAEASAGIGVTSRTDVRRAFEQVFRYYDQHDRSSVVPLFVRAAEQFIDRDFVQTWENLTDDAYSALKSLAGLEPTPQSGAVKSAESADTGGA